MIIPDNNLRKIPIDLRADDRRLISSFGGIIDVIDLVTIQGGRIHIYGQSGVFRRWCHIMTVDRVSETVDVSTFKDPLSFDLSLARTCTCGLLSLTSFQRARTEQKNDYLTKIEVGSRRNWRDAQLKLSRIKLYQGTVAEIEQELGVSLQVVHASYAQAFLQERDSNALRLRAYRLGADAIAHYDPVAYIGTPLRFIAGSALRYDRDDDSNPLHR